MTSSIMCTYCYSLLVFSASFVLGLSGESAALISLSFEVVRTFLSKSCVYIYRSSILVFVFYFSTFVLVSNIFICPSSSFPCQNPPFFLEVEVSCFSILADVGVSILRSPYIFFAPPCGFQTVPRRGCGTSKLFYI